MAFPFFYKETLAEQDTDVVLDEDTSKHVAQVLRMKQGESIQLTNGRGLMVTAVITDDNRKRCVVQVSASFHVKLPEKQHCIAISLLKNNNRFEWFLEKATETGISAIIPLICERTEKQSFKAERMKNILVSAMLQSQQCWLPALCEPVSFNSLAVQNNYTQKLVAHCETGGEKIPLISLQPFSNTCILIGPEGDFTSKEIELALMHGFVPVSLGNTRLRTETAAMAAAVILQLG